MRIHLLTGAASVISKRHNPRKTFSKSLKPSFVLISLVATHVNAAHRCIQHGRYSTQRAARPCFLSIPPTSSPLLSIRTWSTAKKAWITARAGTSAACAALQDGFPDSEDFSTEDRAGVHHNINGDGLLEELSTATAKTQRRQAETYVPTDPPLRHRLIHSSPASATEHRQQKTPDSPRQLFAQHVHVDTTSSWSRFSSRAVGSGHASAV